MIILTIFGVIMVFSSSSVNMIANGQSPLAQALKQGMYCVFGLVIAFITMMLPASFYRKISFWFLLGAMVMQAATLTPLGVEVNGNKGWIGIRGVFTMQPAEIVKLALCIWMPNGPATGEETQRRRSARPAHTPPYSVLYRVCLGFDVGQGSGTGLIVLVIGGVAFLLGEDIQANGLPALRPGHHRYRGIDCLQSEQTGPRSGRVPDCSRYRCPKGVLPGDTREIRVGRIRRLVGRRLGQLPARNGTIFRRRTTISSSPSSARKPDSSERPSSLYCSWS